MYYMDCKGTLGTFINQPMSHTCKKWNRRTYEEGSIPSATYTYVHQDRDCCGSRSDTGDVIFCFLYRDHHTSQNFRRSDGVFHAPRVIFDDCSKDNITKFLSTNFRCEPLSFEHPFIYYRTFHCTCIALLELPRYFDEELLKIRLFFHF